VQFLSSVKKKQTKSFEGSSSCQLATRSDFSFIDEGWGGGEAPREIQEEGRLKNPPRDFLLSQQAKIEALSKSRCFFHTLKETHC
jgi:hypothetical protein